MTGQSLLDGTLAAHRVVNMESLFSLSPAIRRTSLGQALEERGFARIYRLQLEPGSDVLEAVEALAADPSVEYPEPDYLAYAADTIPDYPLFPGQWALSQI